jgi:hypothetical protein
MNVNLSGTSAGSRLADDEEILDGIHVVGSELYFAEVHRLASRFYNRPHLQQKFQSELGLPANFSLKRFGITEHEFFAAVTKILNRGTLSAERQRLGVNTFSFLDGINVNLSLVNCDDLRSMIGEFRFKNVLKQL